ncbi:MAG: twin-arginine translocase TatA/TatE family subunit [Coriobacteriia bacterium]|nr:twin-arginine translocase TatA/TatE family subunit [Coriobacteriia bacterium]
MFGIGGTELIIILLFVFIVVGPEKLPEVATMIGKAIRKFQDAQSEVNKVIKTETADIKAAINEQDSKAKPAAKKPAPAAKAPAEPAATSPQAAAAPATESSAEQGERKLSFSERKAQHQRQRAEQEEAAKQAAQSGEGE